jgi:hypothetical protein
VASETVNKCQLFDLNGNMEETIWNEPGGTMSMAYIPETNGEFLASQRFYSPNDSKEAEIVYVKPLSRNNWAVKVMIKLPFVHRFDIIKKNTNNYLIACTLKSDHNFDEDWNHAGKVYTVVLPKNINDINAGNPLPIIMAKDGMFKNHGYYRHIDSAGNVSAVISCEQGVYEFIPPEDPSGRWEINELVDEPASDSLLLDIDNDGNEELITLAPFHGDTVNIYKKANSRFVKIFSYPEKLEFLHAICGGFINGKNVFITGFRKGERNLLAFTFNGNDYEATIIDRNCGSANVLFYKHNGRNIIISANREIGEIAMYYLS